VPASHLPVVRPLRAASTPDTPNGDTKPDKRSQLQSVARSFAVLEEIAHAPTPVSIPVLAARLGFERTIVHRILRSLQAEKFVEPTRGGYVIGPRALVFGNAYRERWSLRSAALPYMADFARSVGDRQLIVSITMIVGRELLLVDRIWNPSLSLDLVFGPGSRFPLEETASGRALLAYMSAEEVAETVGAEVAQHLESTLARIRATGGIEFQRRPDQKDHCAIAAVILPRSGDSPRSTLLLTGLGLEDELVPNSPSARLVRRYADRIGDLI
jgi:DNA-binding IclR family transcriptional regulator